MVSTIDETPENLPHQTAAPQPFLHTTPPEALGKLIHKSVVIGDRGSADLAARTFEIDYPGDADRLLDHPSTHDAFAADDYMPYWAELWPSAQMLGEALLIEQAKPSWPPAGEPQPKTLEIGCGVGLPGIVALSLGCHVIFSDYDATAIEFAARNAIANGFTNFETLPLDWRVPPNFQVPLILAADVIYEERNIEPLIALIQKVLAPDGMCLLSDPDRTTRGGFRHALKQAGLRFSQHKMEADGPASFTKGRRVKGTVYRIER